MSHTQTKFAQNISAHAAARYWQATLARDSRADGTFVLAVRSTHIYCRPSCPARRPLRRNVTFFRTREEAEKQGYRPCLRCRPNEIAGPVALVQRAAGHLAESSEEGVRLGAVAEALGITQATLRRAFLQVTGLKPRELAEALRIKRFKAMLRSGKSITDALYETGYGSSSRVYERSNAQLGMTPATYRKGGQGMKISRRRHTKLCVAALVDPARRAVPRFVQRIGNALSRSKHRLEALDTQRLGKLTRLQSRHLQKRAA